MDLRDYLLSLMEPVRPGELVAPNLRFTDAATELGLRLTFVWEADGETEIHVEVSPLEHGMRHVARSSRLGFAYRTGGAEKVDSKLGERVCQVIAGVVATREDEVLARLAVDAEAAVELEGTARIRRVTVTRICELGGVPGQRFYTLSPYVGCLIGCRFCYAQSRTDPMRSLLRQPKVPWGSYVDVRVNAAEVLAEELRTRPRYPIKFCPIVSDPYQAVEKSFMLTRACLEVIRDADDPPPAMVMTRSELILRDFDLIREVPGIWVGASVPTIDDAVRAHFEPRAASIPARLAMLRRFKEAGVRRCVVVQPMLPGDPIALADALAEVVDSVSIGVLRGEFAAKGDFSAGEYRHCRDEGWQRDRAFALRDALQERGVDIWFSELPPALMEWRP